MNIKLYKKLSFFIKNFLSILILFQIPESIASPGGTLLGSANNFTKNICEIRAAFCGDTALVIIAVGLLVMAILLLTSKLNWVTGLIFVIGGILFSSAENVAIYLYGQDFEDNPKSYEGIEYCICKYSFLGNILGYEQKDASQAPAGEIKSPNPPGGGACDCTDQANWGAECCKNYGCAELSGEANACCTDLDASTCDPALYWNSYCCSCDDYPSSTLCNIDPCAGVTPASCTGVGGSYDAACCDCTEMLDYDSGLCSGLSAGDAAYDDCCIVDACAGITPSNCIGHGGSYDAACCDCAEMLDYDNICNWQFPGDPSYDACCGP